MSSQQQKLQELLAENAISEQEFAFCLGIETTLANAICQGRKKLSGKLARQIEQTFSKPAFWLDDEMESGPGYDLFG